MNTNKMHSLKVKRQKGHLKKNMAASMKYQILHLSFVDMVLMLTDVYFLQKLTMAFVNLYNVEIESRRDNEFPQLKGNVILI